MSKKQHDGAHLGEKSPLMGINSYQNSSEAEMAEVNSGMGPGPFAASKSARQAFQSQDIEASLAFHAAQRQGQVESHGNAAGPYLKALVYGGVDGIITTFATVTSVAGANLAPGVILIVGIAHLFADGISMGLGDALSSQAEIDYNNAERMREKWEMEVSMEQEIEEMTELYVQRGISQPHAALIWRTLAEYPEAFLDIMMAEELRLLPPDPEEDPWKSGVVTCISFMIFGAVPLIPFLFCLLPGLDGVSEDAQMWAAVVLTVITLFGLGAYKSKLVELGESWVRSGLVVAGLGSFAAFVSYIVGVALQAAFQVSL